MSSKIKPHSPEFKAKVALSAIANKGAIAVLSQQFGVHSSIISTWKKSLIDGAIDIFYRNHESQNLNDKQVDLLYHYCSPSEFTSIINNRTIWLSSLTLSNDLQEGKLISDLLCDLLEQDGLDKETLEKIREAVSFLSQFIDGLGLCLSEDGDLLSQWRGYADDGKGFSIGFSKEYLENLENQSSSKEPKLRQMFYKPSEHLEKILPIYEKIRPYIQTGDLLPPKLHGLKAIMTPSEITLKKHHEAWEKIWNSNFDLLPLLFSLKNEAFSEEKEWRLISHIVKDKYDDKVLFHAGQNKIVPYKEIRLLTSPTTPILKVVIGPKNITPESVIEGFLKQKGFGQIPVKQSRASYR